MSLTKFTYTIHFPLVVQHLFVSWPAFVWTYLARLKVWFCFSGFWYWLWDLCYLPLFSHSFFCLVSWHTCLYLLSRSSLCTTFLLESNSAPSQPHIWDGALLLIAINTIKPTLLPVVSSLVFWFQILHNIWTEMSLQRYKYENNRIQIWKHRMWFSNFPIQCFYTITE